MGRVVDGYREFVKLANNTPKAKEQMEGWDKVVQFIIEGEEDFYIKTEEGKASFHIGEHESPDVTLKGPEEVFYKMLTRELDMTKAYFARKYRIEGSMGAAMKFGRIATAVAKAQE